MKTASSPQNSTISLIDAGAAGYSTAEYGQYQAFTTSIQFFPIDSTQTIEIKFGIGTENSDGLITIPTPIGNCSFHLLNSNTPFLLSMKDINVRRAIFDNLHYLAGLKNGCKILIVRLFGHAFLQQGPTYNRSLGITIKEVSIEAAQIMGIVEWYQKLLRRAYNIVKEDKKSTQKSLTLQMSLEAINNTAGIESIVPIL
ncbi:hypothetical protein EPUL_002953 [Erysiphe pulchra]|uniref:Uncharacterized protein n=1 Tax=Erysiphe pulchra TaxID=225359 RepID=A0A2S4PVS3_9PEZI|nr:hypothetical protein EPUL_002953 [Erysiphe pulchra]